MSHTPKLVTIFGGSGFLGRYIARRMANEGWRVRVAVRRPNEALFVQTYGVVGQVAPILANIRDEDSTAAAIAGADAVVNCVGILQEDSRQRFDNVQADGAERIARLTAEAGIETLVHVSAIGASDESESDYARTKAEGEALVRKYMPDATILRPSIMFGAEDQFFNRFAGMARFTPILPLVGADSKFQPVYVDDVAHAAQKALADNSIHGTFELGGPRVATFRELISKMLQIIRRRRAMLNIPFFAAGIKAWGLDMMQTLTLGLFQNRILTRDQVKQLANDNVVADDAKTFVDLGITPTAMEAELEDYLYRFRPQGQYTALTESAKNL